MNNRNQGCLAGLFELFMLDRLYKWLQKTFGFQKNSCLGCGCGTIFLIAAIIIAISIIFKTNWFKLF
jgi:hypothetical protein